MIIIACGLSKSGKTSLIERADFARLNCAHVRGGALLCNGYRPIEALRASDVITNQEFIVRELLALEASSKRTLLDGHLLIETLDGPQLVPDSVLDPLPLSGLIVVVTDPKIVAKRRLGTRLTSAIEDISDLAQMEGLQARRLARRRRVPVVELDSQDVESLNRILSLWFTMGTEVDR
jgi:adenylate kinase